MNFVCRIDFYYVKQNILPVAFTIRGDMDVKNLS